MAGHFGRIRCVLWTCVVLQRAERRPFCQQKACGCWGISAQGSSHPFLPSPSYSSLGCGFPVMCRRPQSPADGSEQAGSDCGRGDGSRCRGVHHKVNPGFVCTKLNIPLLLIWDFNPLHVPYPATQSPLCHFLEIMGLLESRQNVKQWALVLAPSCTGRVHGCCGRMWTAFWGSPRWCGSLRWGPIHGLPSSDGRALQRRRPLPTEQRQRPPLRQSPTQGQGLLQGLWGGQARGRLLVCRRHRPLQWQGR